MSTFERIKNLAKKNHLTLSEINDKAGLGTNSIYSWKTSTPGTESLKKVAKILNTSTDYLMGNTDDSTRSNNEAIPIDDKDRPYSYHGRHVPEKYLDMVRNLMDSDFTEGKKNEHSN